MVSVIIPVYNGQRYIKTITGCFERQKDMNFELIFINDGSKDKSLDELNKVKCQSNLKIKIINQKNSGVSTARNIGIENAEGDYICFCDVDDEVTEDYVSDMRCVIEDYDVDLVICKHKIMKLDRIYETEGNIFKKHYTENITIKNSTSCLKDFLYGRIVSGCCTIMVKKSILISNRLVFADGYKYSEDLHMLWRIIACSKQTAYLDKELYIYKLQENSATSVFNEERVNGYKLMKNLESFFNIVNPEFAKEYERYGAAKLMWSITWQSAVNMDRRDFLVFTKKYNVKRELNKLISFKNLKVSLSSTLFLISPTLFKFTSRLGKKYIH